MVRIISGSFGELVGLGVDEIQAIDVGDDARFEFVL